MRYGVAVTTHNRPAVLVRALAAWKQFLPAGFAFVVVDDASTPPARGVTWRFDENVGVARAKNKGIELLYDQGCEHLFLVDDDCWPVVPDWWQPYVNDPEPHLMHLWGPSRHIPTADDYRVFSHPRGVMLYAERRVIDQVGGMHTAFGRWGDEHVEWSQRIHNNELTTYAFADCSEGDALWFALDRRRKGESLVSHGIRRERESTMSSKEREASRRQRARARRLLEGNTEFFPFRGAPDGSV